MHHSSVELTTTYLLTEGACFYCGRKLTYNYFSLHNSPYAWYVNYFIPAAGGGFHQQENWVPACAACDYKKGVVFPWDFDPQRFRQGDRDPRPYL